MMAATVAAEQAVVPGLNLRLKSTRLSILRIEAAFEDMEAAQTVPSLPPPPPKCSTLL